MYCSVTSLCLLLLCLPCLSDRCMAVCVQLSTGSYQTCWASSPMTLPLSLSIFTTFASVQCTICDFIALAVFMIDNVICFIGAESIHKLLMVSNLINYIRKRSIPLGRLDKWTCFYTIPAILNTEGAHILVGMSFFWINKAVKASHICQTAVTWFNLQSVQRALTDKQTRT